MMPSFDVIGIVALAGLLAIIASRWLHWRNRCGDLVSLHRAVVNRLETENEWLARNRAALAKLVGAEYHGEPFVSDPDDAARWWR